jgi:hypothetical protein
MRYNESRYAHWNVFTTHWSTTIYVWFYNECNHRISHAKYDAKTIKFIFWVAVVVAAVAAVVAVMQAD